MGPKCSGILKLVLLASLVLCLAVLWKAVGSNLSLGPVISRTLTRYAKIEELRKQIADLEKRLAEAKGEVPAESPDDTPGGDEQ